MYNCFVCVELLFAMNITHVFGVLMVLKVLFLTETINAYDQVRTSQLIEKSSLINRSDIWPDIVLRLGATTLHGQLYGS